MERIYLPNLKKSENWLGFYQNPKRPWFSASKDGVVVDSETGQILNKIVESGYVQCRGVHAHRVVAETFLGTPLGTKSEDYIVNHINGDKSDIRLENLEWCTSSENLIHAYESGLRKDKITVLVKNTDTDEVIKFRSLQECAKHFNSNGATIFNYVKASNKAKLRFSKYLIIKDGEEWPSEIDHGKVNGLPKSIYLLELNNGVEILYKSMSEVARMLEVSGSLLTKLLKSTGKASYNGYELRYADVPQPLRTTERLGNRTNPRKPPKIKVTDLTTNTSRIIQSLEKLAIELGVTKISLQKSVWVNDGVYLNKLHIEYLPFEKETELASVSETVQ